MTLTMCKGQDTKKSTLELSYCFTTLQVHLFQYNILFLLGAWFEAMAWTYYCTYKSLATTRTLHLLFAKQYLKCIESEKPLVKL